MEWVLFHHKRFKKVKWKCTSGLRRPPVRFMLMLIVHLKFAFNRLLFAMILSIFSPWHKIARASVCFVFKRKSHFFLFRRSFCRFTPFYSHIRHFRKLIRRSATAKKKFMLIRGTSEFFSAVSIFCELFSFAIFIDSFLCWRISDSAREKSHTVS